MINQIFLLFCLFANRTLVTQNLDPELSCKATTQISSSEKSIDSIGEKIWRNECGGTIEGLVHWNKGENFPSLGIGHFIWYCEGKAEKFQETFPDLLKFLQANGALIPSWLKNAKGCPWASRQEFYEKIQSPEMKELRSFLYETRALQAAFMVKRLESTFDEILENCPLEDKKQMADLFSLLANDPKGLYAMIDYLNFKGSGIAPAETYNGQGWGLFQVLQKIPTSSKNPLKDFINEAKLLLSQRVKNAPAERNETQWLKGWHNRIDSYSTSDN